VERRNVRPLSLHIPQPTARPGEAPDFSWLEVPPAGQARQPAVDAPAAGMRDLAFDLIRVMDEEGARARPPST
jgi:2-oxoisovalerate dehydrogenase E1 component alpha subunit